MKTLSKPLPRVSVDRRATIASYLQFFNLGGREREREIGVMVGIETGHLTLSLASRQRWVSLVFMDDIRKRERANRCWKRGKEKGYQGEMQKMQGEKRKTKVNRNNNPSLLYMYMYICINFHYYSYFIILEGPPCETRGIWYVSVRHYHVENLVNLRVRVYVCDRETESVRST